jgi:hypothetical protein
MQLSHAAPVRSAAFDDPSLVSSAGLVPALALAQRGRLGELAGERLTVPGGAGSASGAKVASLVAGMVAGADSIDDMDLLRHGAMSRLFTGARAPSTLGLAAIAFNLLRATGALASAVHAKASTATIRTQLINIAARVVRTARRNRLRLPTAWPWAIAWQRLFTAATGPPAST